MGGFFGTVSKRRCIADLFYGTDYNSHLGTRRGGMATFCKEKGFFRSIHTLENAYFRSRFEDELGKFVGNSGIGIISDTDAQPLLMNSHLGRFAIVTVAKINNLEDLAQKLLNENMHLSEFSSGKINPTELVGLLIIKGKNFVDGIENVFREVKGSCTLLLLTEDGIIAARDSWGRTPIVVGKKEDAYAVSSEPFRIWVMKLLSFWAREKLYDFVKLVWNSCASRISACRSVLSYGFIMDSLLLVLKI